MAKYRAHAIYLAGDKYLGLHPYITIQVQKEV